MVRSLLLALVCGCALDAGSGPTAAMPDSTASAGDGTCDGAPVLAPTADWRHTSSSLVANLGDPHHRGIDLIATTADARQVIGGKLAYSDVDKDLEDEDVTLYACFAGTWRTIGSATTDDDGRFTLALGGDARLPAGIRDLYVGVDGDGTGAEFVGVVVAPGAPIIVSDIDGTLTASENAYPIALASGGETRAQDGAAGALAQIAAAGMTIIYVSARGDRFTQDTRDWLASHGFPRGALRLPPAIITLPGDDTVELKSSILASLSAFELIAGLGNRATDVTAYTNAGLPAEQILIKLPEFSDELAADLEAGKATGFDRYAALDVSAIIADSVQATR
jgi:phosphatidate phosphatase PAH1